MSKVSCVIRGGLLVTERGFRRSDVAITEGIVTEIGDCAVDSAYETVDAEGLVVAPSFIDLHTHTRVPGGEESETLESVEQAAILGGYRYLLAMPNTDPAMDSVGVLRSIADRLAKLRVTVEQSSAITIGRAGEQLVDIYSLAEAGVRFFTDDGTGLRSPSLMREALEMSALLGVVIAQHSQDPELSSGGSINEGTVSVRLGLGSIPESAESVMVARDIELLKAYGGNLHVLHVSARESVNLIRHARSEGLRITSEVAPHHLLLDDSRTGGFDPIFKVNPPLRSVATRMALVQACISGEFDAIATDHAPHSDHAKQKPFSEAAFGMLGLQTAFSAAWTAMFNHPGWDESELEAGLAWDQIDGLEPWQLVRLHRVISLLSFGPARVVGIDAGIRVGSNANLVLVDPRSEWVPSPGDIVSRSRNLPYLGMALRGRIVGQILDGSVVLREGKLCS